jgi:hypothetical protein
MRVPDKTPSLIADLQEEYVDRGWSRDRRRLRVSLIGGARSRPEKALGVMGGGAGGWTAERRKSDD